jgi:coiled-coil and C2 domain-containing protein 1
MIPVNIKEKACQRVFKRGIAKVEVLSKGGFLRGDTLLGTASGKKNLIHIFLLLSVCRI